MSFFSDPTANRAIGSLDREIDRQVKLLKEYYRQVRDGRRPEEDWLAKKRRYAGTPFEGCPIFAERAVLREEEEARAREEAKNKTA